MVSTLLSPPFPTVSSSFRFPLPEVPPAWKPDPKRVWAKDANKEKAPVDPSRRQGGITADQVHLLALPFLSRC